MGFGADLHRLFLTSEVGDRLGLSSVDIPVAPDLVDLAVADSDDGARSRPGVLDLCLGNSLYLLGRSRGAVRTACLPGASAVYQALLRSERRTGFQPVRKRLMNG